MKLPARKARGPELPVVDESRRLALEAFEKAATLDDKDPLPHLMKGLAYYDSLELGKAIEAAREALVRMPFLKSLNQVLTDQKGSANLGSALAAFGMAGCRQYVSLDATVVFVPVAGSGSFSFPVPNNPGLSGVDIFLQSLVLASGLNTLGAITSNGVELEIGIQ